MFIRLALSAALLLPLAAGRKALTGVRRSWPFLLGISSVGIVGPFLLIAYGEQHITSSLTALLIAADPLFIVVLALRFDPGERASGTRLIGLCLGLLGVAALVGLNLGGDALGILGASMVLCAALGYAVSALMVKRLSMPPLGSTALTLTIAGLLLAPPAVAAVPRQVPSAAALVSVLALGIACTAVAYVINYELIVEAGATRASLITYVNPAVAVMLGVLVLVSQSPSAR